MRGGGRVSRAESRDAEGRGGRSRWAGGGGLRGRADTTRGTNDMPSAGAPRGPAGSASTAGVGQEPLRAAEDSKASPQPLPATRAFSLSAHDDASRTSQILAGRPENPAGAKNGRRGASGTSATEPAGGGGAHLVGASSSSPSSTTSPISTELPFSSSRIRLVGPLTSWGGGELPAAASKLFLARDMNAAAETGASAECVVKRTVTRDRQRLRSAEQEIALLKKARHPNIVRAMGAWQRTLADGAVEVNLVLEPMKGGHLLEYASNRLKSGRALTELDIARLFLQAARAVEHLHRFHPPIAHRDVKLENLLLDAECKTVKLCDLGSATTWTTTAWTKEDRARLEQEVETLTTPSYRAPEMIDNLSRVMVCEQVDVWALACCLYLLSFSRHAFGDPVSNLAVLSGNFTIPAEPYYSDEFKLLFHWMFTVDPFERPRVGDIVDELDSLLGNRIKYTAKERGSGVGARARKAVLSRGAGQTSTPPALRPKKADGSSPVIRGAAYVNGGATTTSKAAPQATPRSMRESGNFISRSPSKSGAPHNATTSSSESSERADWIDAELFSAAQRRGVDVSSPILGPTSATPKAAAAALAASLSTSSGAAGSRGPITTPTAAAQRVSPTTSAGRHASGGSKPGRAAAPTAAPPSSRSNNPFDDFDAPSASPTFYSNPGMSSTSLAGFPTHLSSATLGGAAPGASSLSFAQPDGGVPTSLSAATMASSGDSFATVRSLLRPGGPSQAPIFFSEPPIRYYRTASDAGESKGGATPASKTSTPRAAPKS